MIQSPPPPTLFPYTTLFRSKTFTVVAIAFRKRGGLVPIRGFRKAPRRGAMRKIPNIERLEKREYDFSPDRKSTRLNSSHRCISYAVFCLKKKTKRAPHPYRA